MVAGGLLLLSCAAKAPCSPSSCFGCCSQGECVTGVSSSACGASGSACAACPAGQQCVSGACLAGGGVGGGGGGTGGGIGGGGGATTGGLTVLKGEIDEGSGPAGRLVLAQIQLANHQSVPLPLLAPLFKLRLSTGLEFPGSPTLTAATPGGCPAADVSVGATTTCVVAFSVDLSSAGTSVVGVAYTLPDQTQWVVTIALPTCEQCGQFLGCANFQSSNFACGGCGRPCSSFQACVTGTCVAMVIVSPNPSDSTCAQTCAPKRCISLAVSGAASSACQRALAGLTCTDAFPAACSFADLLCVCEG